MEHIRFNFQCRVIRKTVDGFIALLKDEYVIKFRDTKYHYFFEEGDLLEITAENTENNSDDEVKEDYAIIYVILHSFLSNGFLFRDIGVKKGFYWTNRGMLTHKRFEGDDIFSDSDIIKIVIKKLSFYIGK